MIKLTCYRQNIIQLIDEHRGSMIAGRPYTITIKPFDSKREDEHCNYFDLVKDRYAEAMGYSKPYARAELKYLYGINYRYGQNFKPPKRSGRFVEIYGEIVFQISTNEYRMSETNALIKGMKQACYENSIDISDLEDDDET